MKALSETCFELLQVLLSLFVKGSHQDRSSKERLTRIGVGKKATRIVVKEIDFELERAHCEDARTLFCNEYFFISFMVDFVSPCQKLHRSQGGYLW